MSARRGFTLIELLLAIGLFGVLSSAMGGIILLSARALPGAQPDADRATSAAGTLSRLTAEASMATSIVRGTATGVVFVVPDITGDGTDDQIEYAWLGASDGRVTRTLNSGKARVIATGVTSMELSYVVQGETLSGTASWSTSTGATLANFDGSSINARKVAAGMGYAMVFAPTLPRGAISYDITNVQLRAQYGGVATDGRVDVSVRTTSSAKPGATVLGTGTLVESLLMVTTAWRSVNISGATGLAPGSSVAVVAMWGTGDEAARVGVADQAPTGATYYETSDSGVTWGTHSSRTLSLIVTGDVTVSSTSASTSATRVRRIDATLRVGDDRAGEASASVLIGNRPEVSG